MKTISSSLTILGIVTVIGGLPCVVNAEPAPVLVNGARYFQNLGISKPNIRDYEKVFNNNNEILVTYPSFTIQYSADNPNIYPVGTINSNGTPQYTYNNRGVVVLELGNRERAIPYNRQGDANLLFRLDSGK